MGAREQSQAFTAMVEQQQLKEGADEQQQCASDVDDNQPIVSLCPKTPLPIHPVVVSGIPGRLRGGKRKRDVVENNSDHFESESSLVILRAEDVQIVSDDAGKRRGRKRKEDLAQNNFEVLKRAEAVRASLSPEFPVIIKLMTRSHVSKGFWLGLPMEFCKLYMPTHDETVVLENESGEQYRTNFLFDKMGLSAGWRGFSIAEKLLVGDVVVLQLVGPCIFKVYVVRANDFGAYPEKETCEKAEEKHLAVIPVNKENIERADNIDLGPEADQPECVNENLYSEIECFMLSGTTSDLKNFRITLNGISVDSKLPEYLRSSYYDLCCTQKSCLHDYFLKSVNKKLAGGMILETIAIADAIRSCKLSTLEDDFTIWDKTLEAFELLGMDVGFLRARISRLEGLASESRKATTFKRYQEACVERGHAEEETKSLELKLLKLKQNKDKLDEEIKVLKENAQREEVKFQEEAGAPW